MKRILLLLLIFNPVFGISQSETVSLVINGGTSSYTLKNNIEMSSSILLSEINKAFIYNKENLGLSERFITADVINKLNDLWEEKHFYCKIGVVNEPLVKNNGVYQVRNIPMIFDNDELLEFVLDFSDEGKVNGFDIALETRQYKSILEATGVVDQTRREIILNFLENMRTAYMRKDIDFVEKLYSEKALIIVGKVIKPIDSDRDFMKSSLSENEVEYQVMSKKEYINKLKKVFEKTPYLKLDFDSIKVTRHKKFSNFYGVLLRQKWMTADYQDDGILFLIIQFNNDNNPLIWVRTWQDAQKTPEDQIFGFYRFKIVTGDFVN